ncbi:MAG: ABC transporter substrate-binding protein, partial [Chloroflexi bacterium]
RWALVYSDYAYGQSQAVAYGLGLQMAGGDLAVKVAIPLNETNVTPYITKIPTDGSITGVIDTQAGADVLRSLTAMQQFGINKKMPVVGVFGKERWAGVYPDIVNGSLAATNALSDYPKDNAFDVQYHRAFRAQLAKEDPSLLSTLGPVDGRYTVWSRGARFWMPRHSGLKMPPTSTSTFCCCTSSWAMATALAASPCGSM